MRSVWRRERARSSNNGQSRIPSGRDVTPGPLPDTQCLTVKFIVDNCSGVNMHATLRRTDVQNARRAACVLLAVLASCSSGPTDSAPGSHRVEVLKQYWPDANVSIIDTLLYGTKSGAFELELDGYNAMSQCVAEAGFEWHAVRPTRALIEADVVPIVRPLSLEAAAAGGYGMASQARLSSATSITAGFDDYRNELSQTERDSFDAVTRQCRQSTNKVLFADRGGYELARQNLEKLRLDMSNRFSGLAGIRGLNETWSKCVTAAGFTIATPDDAPAFVISNGGQRDTEIEVATADARCRLADDYEARYLDTFYDLESSFVFDHQALILDVVQRRYTKPNG